MPEYKDDPSISDEAELWRRIRPDQIVSDQNLGFDRSSSAAFNNSSDGSPMSVIIEEIMREFGKGTEDVLRGYKGFALAAITAGLARRNKQCVARDPLHNEPAHGVVIGKKTKSISRQLAKGSTWVLRPTQGLF